MNLKAPSKFHCSILFHKKKHKQRTSVSKCLKISLSKRFFLWKMNPKCNTTTRLTCIYTRGILIKAYLADQFYN